MVPDPTTLLPSLSIGEEDEVLEFDGCTTSIVIFISLGTLNSNCRFWHYELVLDGGWSMLDGIREW